jgi:hypothetical protein
LNFEAFGVAVTELIKNARRHDTFGRVRFILERLWDVIGGRPEMLLMRPLFRLLDVLISSDESVPCEELAILLTPFTPTGSDALSKALEFVNSIASDPCFTNIDLPSDHRGPECYLGLISKIADVWYSSHHPILIKTRNYEAYDILPFLWFKENGSTDTNIQKFATIFPE